jgi:hypothetical protein
MKKFNWVLISILTVALFSSCAAGKSAGAYDTRSSLALGYFDNSLAQDKETDLPTVADTQKIVYTARLQLTVKNSDSASKQIMLLTKNNNGYVQTSNSYYLIVKIPSQGLNNMLTEIEKMGKLTHKDISAVDITDNYYDAITRLDNLEKARTRYLELLAKAQTVEEMLKVEKELERVNGEMEILKGQLTRMDNNVQYSTITVYLKEKVKPGILGYPFVWLYKGVSWLFVRN